METLVGTPLTDPDEFVAKVIEIGQTSGCLAQAVDAIYVAGPRHVETAVRLTCRAIERATTIADDPYIELLLYLAGTRQIERAVALGVDAETDAVLVVLAGDDEAAARAEIADRLVAETTTDRPTDPDRIRSWFGISRAEEGATEAPLDALVAERVALLQLEA